MPQPAVQSTKSTRQEPVGAPQAPEGVPPPAPEPDRAAEIALALRPALRDAVGEVVRRAFPPGTLVLRPGDPPDDPVPPATSAAEARWLERVDAVCYLVGMPVDRRPRYTRRVMTFLGWLYDEAKAA